MSKDSPELDLYADDIDEFSVQEYNNTHDELFNDALTPTNKRNSDDEQKFNNQNQNSLSNANTNNTSSNNNNSSNNAGGSTLNSSHHTSNNDSTFTHSYKKPCVYIGNLTWWTTDDDVRNGLNSINVNDVIEVKFFENRSNGQSKGFCVVTMQSDNSVKVAIEKFKNCLIHNQHPIVTLCNRQNLNNFEMKSRKPGLNGQNHPNNSNNQNQNNNQNNNNNNNNNNNYMNNRNNYNQNHMQGGGQRPPLITRPMRPNGPLLNQPRLVNMPQSMQFGGNNQQSWPHMMSNGPRNALHNPSNQINPLLRLNQNRPMSNQPLLSAPSSQVDLRTQMSTMGNLAHSMNTPHSALFSNPQSNLLVSQADIYTNARMPGAMNTFGQTTDFPRSTVDVVSGMQMSEAEFEEIISKNKNLSTNAISKALNDATTGDYTSALDTLTMAISLIKGSRVSHDDRCKAIILSLQDTYQGISIKAQSNERNSSSDRRDRNDRIARSRSRDRGGSSHRSGRDKDRRDSRRDRSRSRDRDYRERSRDRYHEDHRSYEDRYRDKDRDHGRHRH